MLSTPEVDSIQRRRLEIAVIHTHLHYERLAGCMKLEFHISLTLCKM